jgi:hypothetical protein
MIVPNYFSEMNRNRLKAKRRAPLLTPNDSILEDVRRITLSSFRKNLQSFDK